MKIDSTNLSMASSRQYQRTEAVAVKEQSLVSRAATMNEIRNAIWGKGKDPASGTEDTDIGSNFSDLFSDYSSSGVRNVSSIQDRIKSIQEIRYQTLNYLMMALFGRNYGVYRDGLMDIYSGSGAGFSGTGSYVTAYKTMEMSYEFSETEATSFSTEGTVKTADGREISFNVNLTMSREFSESAYAKRLDQVTYMDPLVINLDTDIASVSDQSFYFDLDSDGVLDSIHMPTSGGFLALDKNGDGQINDGSELFGTESGDGFADLSVYDEDKNGWIDENDSVFKDLLIWMKDPEGNDRLVGLSKAGVGAICLSNVSTNFSLNDMETNESYAAIRKSGIYLTEDGNVGTIQHVDLAY